MAIRSPVLPPKTEYGKGNTDCHGHKCPRNDVGEFTLVRLHMVAGKLYCVGADITTPYKAVSNNLSIVSNR